MRTECIRLNDNRKSGWISVHILKHEYGAERVCRRVVHMINVDNNIRHDDHQTQFRLLHVCEGLTEGRLGGCVDIDVDVVGILVVERVN